MLALRRTTRLAEGERLSVRVLPQLQADDNNVSKGGVDGTDRDNIGGSSDHSNSVSDPTVRRSVNGPDTDHIVRAISDWATKLDRVVETEWM